MRTDLASENHESLLSGNLVPPTAAAAVLRGTTSFAARARTERRGVLAINQVAALGRLHTDGAMTPGELAVRLRTQPQSLTRTLARCERDGLLRRTPDPGDGRQSLLSITPEGRLALGAEMQPREEWAARAMDTLTPAERDLLVIAGGLLERLARDGAGVAPPER